MFEMRRLLPESVVWLCASNRVAEAEVIIRNAAKLNNIAMPDKILAQPDTAETPDSDGEKIEDGARKKRGRKLLDKFRNPKVVSISEKTKDRRARYTLLDMCRNRHLTINLIIMAYLWSVMSFSYCVGACTLTEHVRL